MPPLFLRRIVLAITTAFAVSGCSENTSQHFQWTTYRSTAAGFEVVVPEGYSVSDDPQLHAFGEHPGHSVYWRKPALDIRKLGLKLVSAGYYDISGQAAGFDAGYVLDSFVNEEERLGGTSANGRVIEMNRDSLQGFPARRIRSLLDNGKSDSLYLDEQFVLRGSKMYHLQLNGYRSVLDTAMMGLVRRSFRLLANS